MTRYKVPHIKIIFYLGILLLGSLCFKQAGYCEEAQLKDVVITNTRDDLLCYFSVDGAFTEQINEAILNGVPTSFSFFVTLQRVRNMWFNETITDFEIIHTIKYNTLKKEFSITRSEKNSEPVTVKSIEEAKKLMANVDNFKVAPLNILIKNDAYQVKAKAMLSKVTLPLYLHYILFFVSLWDFETNWHAINFIY